MRDRDTKLSRLELLRAALMQETQELPDYLLQITLALPLETAKPSYRRLIPEGESFHLLAAASPTPGEAMICRSQNGDYTLQTFIMRDDGQPGSKRGSITLRVNPDKMDIYEGLRARFYSLTDTEKHFLAEKIVSGGMVYVALTTTVEHLLSRDAVFVEFEAVADSSP